MQRLTSSLLAAMALGLAALPAGAEEARFDFRTMTPDEKAAFGEAVREYLLTSPEVIFDAITILEQRRNAAAADQDRALIDQHAEALFSDGFSFVGGNPEGDVTVVEFSDYRCGYCKRAHPHVKDMLELDGNVRLIVKEFPILGPDSVAAARIAMAALEIDGEKYAALNHELMSFQGSLTESIAYRLAAEVGYDIGTLKEVAATDAITEKVKKTHALAEALGIQGTPSFVIGDQIIRGYIETDQMLAAVEAARKTR